MSQPEKFRFSLRKDASTWFAIDAAGDVIEQSTPYYLEYSPDKWEDTEVKWARNAGYWGINRTFTTPYAFVEDGAQILRHVYYNGGAEAACFLDIEICSDEDWTYSMYYGGEVDCSMLTVSRTNVTANIIEGGVAAFVKAKESTPVEIPVLDADCLTIKMDGIKLLSTANYVMPEQGVLADIPLSVNPLIGVVGMEGTNAGDQYQQIDVSLWTGGVPPVADRKIYLAERDQIVTVEISNVTYYAHWPVAAGSPATFVIAARHLDIATNIASDYTIFNAGVALSPGTNATYARTLDSVNITMLAGDMLGIYAYMLQGSGVVSSIDARFKVLGNTGKVAIKSVSRVPESIIRGYRYHEVFEKVVDAASGGDYSGSSTFLSSPAIDRADHVDSKPYNLAISPGDAVRGIGDGDIASNPAKIKTTLKDIFNDSAYRWMVALKETDTGVSIVPLAEVLDNTTEIADLGEVRDFTCKSDRAALFNLLKIGTPEQTYDTLNGKDEPNQTSTFALPTKRKPEGKEMVSPFRADMYGIEQARENLAGKNTTDSASDNGVFLIDLSDTITAGSYELYRPNNTGNTSGILFPDTAFNLTLTPKRNLLRNAPLIAAAVHGISTGSVTFQTSDKNPALVSDLGTGVITENADVPVANFGTPLFLPHLFRFTAQVPVNIMDLMNTNPYGYFSFMWEGVPLKGFPVEVGTRPANYDTYEFTLLCCPDVDLTTLQ